MNEFNLTLVTAFVVNVNNREDRKLDKYIDWGSKLLNIKIPKIIFLENDLIPLFKDIQPEYNFIIPYSLKNIYLFKYLNQITNPVNSDNLKKDTLEYFIVQCNKTEWVRFAISLNKFNSKQYMWVDFGIFQFYEKLNISNEEKISCFDKDVLNTSLKLYNEVRIPHIWDLNLNYSVNLKTNISWYFAGSLFGGDKDKLIIFANKMKEYCLKMIENEKILVWEVNIWYYVYHENKDLFNLYNGGHDTNIFLNY